MIPVPASGIFQGVSGEPEAAATPHVSKIAITGRVHDYIAAWPEGSSYLGFLFARGETAAEAEQAIRNAYQKLEFTITPRLPVEHPATRWMPAGRN